MRLFDLPQAKHFCVRPPVVPGTAQSLPSFHSALPSRVTHLAEGTPRFQIHQANIIDSVERWIVFSLSHYRRAFDMFVPVSAPWAQVTLYYSSFYAANAVLGMFGGWIGHSKTGVRVVDVDRGVVGGQELQIHRKPKSPNGAVGSHRVFWDFFYDAAAAISPWAPVDLALALDPVNNDFAWQINERNNVNYDMFYAWTTSSAFARSFKPARLDSLAGPTALQLEKTEQMIELALHLAKECALPGAALEGCGATGNRLQLQKRLVTKAAPQLVMQSQLSTLLVT